MNGSSLDPILVVLTSFVLLTNKIMLQGEKCTALFKLQTGISFFNTPESVFVWVMGMPKYVTPTWGREGEMWGLFDCGTLSEESEKC